jgi:hypothetical protein
VIKVGGDLCHCLFGYGVKEFCSTTFKNVFQRSTIPGSATVSEQLYGHGCTASKRVIRIVAREPIRGNERKFSIPKPLPSMARLGGVGGFFSYPVLQIRKCHPPSRF